MVLLAALIPRIAEWQRIEAVVGEADAIMLAELIRCLPRTQWPATSLSAGSKKPLGRLLRSAQLVNVTRR